jgi:microcin C transport system permease protein
MAEHMTSHWRRFRRNPRAFASLIALGALYFLSLFSEFICNAKPLVVRANGRTLLPFIRHVSENDILGNGVHSSPDYEAIAATNESTRVIFAPIRFGPRTIATPASLAPYRRVRAVIRPAVRAGRIDLRPDLTVSRQDGAEIFFGSTPAAGTKFTDIVSLPEGLESALAARFANKASPAATFTVATSGAAETELSLPAYETRAAPPRTVRLRLRDARAAKATPVGILFALEDGEPVPVRSSRKAFARLDDATRAAVREAVASLSPKSKVLSPKSNATAPDSQLSTLNSPNNGTISASMEDVTWPFRPVPGHPMGIDNAGRDVFARVLYGTRTAMTFGLLLVAWSLLIGIIAGAAQGYFGGWVDLAGQRFIEIWSALPFLYVMILIGSVFGRSFGLLLFCYGLFNWIGVSYYVRAEFLRLRKRPFVEAAKCQGLGAWRIIRRHILPNALTPVITLLPFNLVGAIASISALDFLGFGLPPLTPSWGELLQQAQQNTSSWWLILYPSLLLFLTMLLTVFVGEGLRDAFDPKPNSRYS